MKRQLDAKEPGAMFFPMVLAAAVVVAGAYAGYRYQQASARERAEAQIVTWFEGPRLMAEVMMERYGPPDELGPGIASWSEKGVWKRIVVHGDRPDTYLEQTVGYRVPLNKLALLPALGNGIKVDEANDEMSARGDRESLNLLALNLADEVFRGVRSLDEMNEAYVKEATLAASGKSSRYMQWLLFAPYRPEPAGLGREGLY